MVYHCKLQTWIIDPRLHRTTPAWEQHCLPPIKLSCTAAATFVSFNRDDVEWAKYKKKQGGT